MKVEPIINPWVFYLIDVVDSLKNVLWCVGGIFFCTLIVYFIGYMSFDDGYRGDDEKRKEKCVKYATVSIGVLILVGVLQIAIPSKNTMYQMLAARYITTDNIGSAQNNVVELVGRIVQEIERKKK